MTMIKRVGIWVLCALIIFSPFFLSSKASASISSCSASLNPSTISPSTTTDLAFTIHNTDTSSILWVNVSSPSANYTVVGGNGAGWTQVSNDNTQVTYTGGSIVSAQTGGVSVRLTTDASTHSSEVWAVQVSDDPAGANPFTCAGSPTTQIAGQAPDITPPNIYNIGVEPLSSTSVKITWLTDEISNSQVDYGADSSYGSTVSDGSLVINHSQTISGLDANTGYHYQVSSADAASNIGYSGDNTFLTVEPPIKPITNPSNSPAATITSSTNISVFTPVPVKPVPSEKTPPVIHVLTQIHGAYKAAPLINGTATDNEVLAAIEYSLDNGIDWLPVDSAPGLGGNKTNFSFTPQNLKDGNYPLRVRAIDTSSNQAVTDSQTLVIDLLPPIIGGSVIMVGSQVVSPDKNAVIHAQTRIDQKITLSAVGGPISVVVEATMIGKNNEQQTYTLIESADTGLWSGILSFSLPGSYQLSVNAVDGAGNKTARPLSSIIVSPTGKVSDKSGKALLAKISVYTRDQETNGWVLWDGDAYTQPNPIATSSKGTYDFYLPAGDYYLKASAAGYQTINTHIFKLDQPTAINPDFKLSHKPGFDVGPIHLRLPWPALSQSSSTLSGGSDSGAKSSLLNRILPQFTLPMTNAKSLSTAQLYGKPTIITFFNTWAPSARDQLAILDQLSQPNINVIPVASGESLSKLQSYSATAGYVLPTIADSNDALIVGLSASSVPVSYFLDRHGVVQKVVTGVLSKQELLANVSL
jgi:peroxiredoxin